MVVGSFLELAVDERGASPDERHEVWAVDDRVAASPAVSNLVSSVALKADDASVVHISGAELVAGVKTFTSSPVIPDAPSAHQPVSYSQLSSAIRRAASVTVAPYGSVAAADYVCASSSGNEIEIQAAVDAAATLPTGADVVLLGGGTTGSYTVSNPVHPRSKVRLIAEGMVNLQHDSGTIRLTGDGEDFSQDTPHHIGINVPYYAGQVRYASGRISLEWRNAAASLWVGNRDPSSNQCVATINAQPLSRDEMGGVRYKQSIGICYAFGDNVVFLRGLSPNAADTVQANATKWAK